MPDEIASVAETDANGDFTLDCPPSYEQGYLQMAASSTNSELAVLVVNRPSMPQPDLGYWPDAANASVNECGAYTGVYAVGAPSQAETFDGVDALNRVKSRTHPRTIAQSCCDT